MIVASLVEKKMNIEKVRVRLRTEKQFNEEFFHMKHVKKNQKNIFLKQYCTYFLLLSALIAARASILSLYRCYRCFSADTSFRVFQD